MTLLEAAPAVHRTRPARTYGAALAALTAAQKPGAGVPAYTRWVNRRLARYAAAAAYRAGWGPNAVTAASAACTALAVALLLAVPAAPGAGLAIGLLLVAGYVLDSADGQVARLSGTGSLAGEWLDHVVDALRTPAVHLAVVAGAALHGGSAVLQVAGLVYCTVAVGQFMSQILAEQLAGRVHRAEQGDGVRKSLVLLPTDNGVFCLLFLLWGLPAVFTAGYLALLAVTAVHTAVSMRRKYRHLQSLSTRTSHA